MTERKRKTPKNDYPLPWEQGPISIERWQRNRQLMLEHAYAGHRPEEWWLYDRQMAQPNNQEDVLYDMGELSEAELAELRPMWREHYEQALRGGFSYRIECAGIVSWLEGEEARKAFYRWACIPRAIVKQWDDERQRREQTIPDDPIELRQEILTLIEQYEIALDLLSEGEVRKKMLQEIAELRVKIGKIPPPPLAN